MPEISTLPETFTSERKKDFSAITESAPAETLTSPENVASVPSTDIEFAAVTDEANVETSDFTLIKVPAESAEAKTAVSAFCTEIESPAETVELKLAVFADTSIFEVLFTASLNSAAPDVKSAFTESPSARVSFFSKTAERETTETCAPAEVSSAETKRTCPAEAERLVFPENFTVSAKLTEPPAESAFTENSSPVSTGFSNLTAPALAVIPVFAKVVTAPEKATAPAAETSVAF